MPYVDFQQLKERVTIEEAARQLGLVLRHAGETLRGPCPACQSGGDRAIVVTPAKQVFYCFAAKEGGDLIRLAAHIRKCDLAQAARFLDGNSGTSSGKGRTVPGTVGTVPQLQQILERLQPEHEAVQALGIGPQTASAFESGILRGRYSVALRDPKGALIGFAGIATAAEQSPRLKFPESLDPATVLFNAHRVGGQPEVFLLGTPLDAIRAVENGIPIDSVIAFCTPVVSAQQLEMLAALLDERKIEGVAL